MARLCAGAPTRPNPDTHFHAHTLEGELLPAELEFPETNVSNFRLNIEHSLSSFLVARTSLFTVIQVHAPAPSPSPPPIRPCCFTPGWVQVYGSSPGGPPTPPLASMSVWVPSSSAPSVQYWLRLWPAALFADRKPQSPSLPPCNPQGWCTRGGLVLGDNTQYYTNVAALKNKWYEKIENNTRYTTKVESTPRHPEPACSSPALWLAPAQPLAPVLSSQAPTQDLI